LTEDKDKPKKIIEELTPEQEAMIPVIRDEWLEMIYNSVKIIDHEKVKETINWLYEISGFNPPTQGVVFAKSPMEVQKIANEMNNTMDNKEFYNFLWKNPLESWPVFYYYFKRIGLLDSPMFDKYLEYLKCGIGWIVCFDEVAIVAPLWKEIHQDEDFQLHNINGPAISWADGYALYYVNGVYFDKQLYTKAIADRLLTGAEILKIRNTEQKSIIIKLYGLESILDDVDSITLDTYTGTSKITGQEVNYKLIEFPIDGVRVRSVVVECHTEHKLTALGVPINKDTGTCMGAIAWTFGMKEDEYRPLMET